MKRYVDYLDFTLLQNHMFLTDWRLLLDYDGKKARIFR